MQHQGDTKNMGKDVKAGAQWGPKEPSTVGRIAPGLRLSGPGLGLDGPGLPLHCWASSSDRDVRIHGKCCFR